MIRQCRITRSRTDAAIPFADQIFVRQIFSLPVTPLFANLLMQPFRKRFGEPIGQSLCHDRTVIVVFLLEFCAELFDAGNRHGKGTDVVGPVG